MPEESELTKKITKVVKLGDKLVQDAKRDVGQIMAAAVELKGVLDDIKDRFRDTEEK